MAVSVTKVTRAYVATAAATTAAVKALAIDLMGITRYEKYQKQVESVVQIVSGRKLLSELCLIHLAGATMPSMQLPGWQTQVQFLVTSFVNIATSQLLVANF